jgi:leucyl/phenylalanyl-tRNA--protein transferase
MADAGDDTAADDDDGVNHNLVAVGGRLTPERLLRAYRTGSFPWYNEGDPVLWWSPDPRAIIEFDRFHVSRRLARTIRSGAFSVTVNADFRGVIAGCADRPGEGTWITRDVADAYTRLHELGHAHSVETWHDGELAGGVYGVAVGGFFAGESMFHHVTDASKVALAALVERLRERGFVLFDIQFTTPHTRSLGATTLPRTEYLRRLARAVTLPVTFVDH